ncbi:MAG: serine/threonine protein kinase [Planctomycetes bacterium]|nr:serine/threonine protein kinase [Planctomycetota bacterium]
MTAGASDSDLPPTAAGPATPAAPAGLGAPGTGGLDATTPSSVPPQDLSADKLLATAPRLSVADKPVPALGGIPLLAKLGQGGMGAVYYGRHPRLNVEVAVKVLPFNLADQNPGLIERFYREANIAARVRSPHLVQVTDVNEDCGLFFLVMEFVRGTSAGSYLRALRQAGRPGLSETTALDICIAAAQGLSAAHAEGVIHRDIKPDNIMLPYAKGTEEPQFQAAKLADLGLARGEGHDRSLTGTQAAMGTPGYMAPEQGMDAKNARKPADVFSMGATLYALLSGNAPFTGSSLMKVLLDTAQSPHVPIRQLRPEVSGVTEAVLARCLAKDPAQRYPDAFALLEALKICRRTIGEPEATLRQALEQVTLLQQAAEVGAPLPAASAPQSPAPPPAAGPEAPTPRRAACAIHPASDAAFLCHRCGKAHCAACRRVLANGREVCVACTGAPQAVQSVQSGFCERCIEQSQEQSPGSISTTNGVGRKFYGAADTCPDCGAVVRTLWFALIDFPLIPLGSYRYKPIGEEGMRSVQFLARRTALRWEQVFATWFIGLLVAGVIGLAVYIYQTYYKQAA